jgi:nucleoside-diphosphate-sugar epimerase
MHTRKVLNLDLVDFPDPNAGVFTLKTDLTQSGQVFNALTTHYNFEGYETGKAEGPPDVVIHFAAYARNMLVPDNECFRGNVLSTYNVIEAASKLGVKKIITASSETTYGVCFSEGDTDYHSFPLEEDYDVDPMDSYALSKICGEKTAKTFARRYGNDIYVLRVGNVVEPHEYERDFPTHVNEPMTRKRNAWSYIDARDLGQCATWPSRSLILASRSSTLPTVSSQQRFRPNSSSRKWRPTRPLPGRWMSGRHH